MSDLKERTKTIEAGPKGRHRTVQVVVGNVKVGGGAPIVVQSMTNTDTADVDSTVKQVAAKRGFNVGQVACEVRIDRSQPQNVKLNYALRFDGPLTDSEAQELREAASRCPVARTLSAAIAIESPR